MKNPTAEIGLPGDLVAYVDSLEYHQLGSLSEPSFIDFRLSYGSLEEQDGLLERLDEDLGYATTAYISELEKFLATSPGQGLPSHVVKDAEIPPEYEPYHKELEGWLDCAKQHLPGAEAEVMDQVVDSVVETFNAEQFELAPIKCKAPYEGDYRIEERRNRLRGTATKLAASIAQDLYSYADDPATIRRFLASSFMNAYGSASDQLKLQRRLLDMVGEVPTDGFTRDQVTASIKQMAAGIPWGDSYSHFDWLIRQNPNAVVDVITQDPKQAAEIRRLGRRILAKIDPTLATQAQAATLATLERQAADGIGEYVECLRGSLSKTGRLTAGQIEQLQLLVTEANGRVDAFAHQALVVFLPIDEAVTHITRYPDLLTSSGMATLCVRRLARDGRLDEAYDIARHSHVIDTMGKKIAPVHNLLVIYDETGDEAALREADELLADLWHNDSYFDIHEVAQHKLAARQYVATRRHGNPDRAAQALTDMEPFYNHKYWDVRKQCLAQRIRLCLDDNDLRGAEHYAVRHHTDPDRGRHDEEVLLIVLDAYLQAGDTASAANLVRTYYATDVPGADLTWALEIFTRAKSYCVPHLFANSLDEIADFYRPSALV